MAFARFPRQRWGKIRMILKIFANRVVKVRWKFGEWILAALMAVATPAPSAEPPAPPPAAAETPPAPPPAAPETPPPAEPPAPPPAAAETPPPAPAAETQVSTPAAASEKPPAPGPVIPLAQTLAPGPEGEPAPSSGERSTARPPAGDASKPAAPASPIQFSLPSPINQLEKKIDYPIDGTFTNRYRLRLLSGSSDSDQDFIQVLSMRFGDPEKNKLSGVFLGRLSEDIDGRAPSGQFDPFHEITDTYDSNVDGRFYLGYADLRHLDWMDRSGLEAIRGGRQSYDEGAESFIFDGGRIDTRAFEALKDFRLSAYGGLPVHYYDSRTSGEGVGGVGGEVTPFHQTRLRADYTYVKDIRAGFDDHNNLASFALWQGVGDQFSFHGRYSLLDGESRDYTVRGTYRDAPDDLLLQASFYQLLMTERDLSTELDPYSSILMDYQPFWEATFRASKGLGEHFLLDGGVTVRELINESDESTFNHEFQRYYITPSTRSWPAEGMNISLTGEFWNSTGDDVYSTGFDISQRFLKVLLASFGSYYSLYKVDFLTGQERVNDRTFYWKLDYQVLKDLKLTALYDLERDDIDTYHTVEIGLRYSF
jgi:hypothetical protein